MASPPTGSTWPPKARNIALVSIGRAFGVTEPVGFALGEPAGGELDLPRIVSLSREEMVAADLMNFGRQRIVCKCREDLLNRNGRDYVDEPYVGILGCELALEPITERAEYSTSKSDEVELPGIEATAGLLGLG
jgi:hypothetical protein